MRIWDDQNDESPLINTELELVNLPRVHTACYLPLIVIMIIYANYVVWKIETNLLQKHVYMA